MASEDEDKKPTGEESDAEDQEQDDDTDTSGGEEDEEEEDEGEDENDSKPVTLKDLKEFRKGITSELNNRFAARRHANKPPTKPYTKPASDKGGKGEEDPLVGRLTAIEVSNAKRDYGYEHNLSPREVDLVFKFANGKPTAKTLNHPFVKGGLEQLRASSNLRNNTPSGSSSSSFEVEGKKFEELDSSGKQKNFAAKQKAILASKKR